MSYRVYQDYDDVTCVTLSDTRPVARKEHTCGSCKKTIPVGARATAAGSCSSTASRGTRRRAATASTTNPDGQAAATIPAAAHVSIVSPLLGDVRHIAVPSPTQSVETLVCRLFRDHSTQYFRVGVAPGSHPAAHPPFA